MRLDLDHSGFTTEIVTKADLETRDQTTLHRIPMNVTKLLYKVFLTPEVEIVAADGMASGRVSCSGSLTSMRTCSGMIT
jgi:hypothetical protein